MASGLVILRPWQTDHIRPSISSFVGFGGLPPPDPAYILAQTITMTGAIGMDPYAALGILLEGAVQTVVKQIPAERQAEAAAALVELLIERLAACGIPGSYDDQDKKKPA